MATDKKSDEVFKKELSKQFYDVMEKVIVSEKATRLIEFENKMVFQVVKGANKSIIKLLIETEFDKKVKSVNTVNAIDGKKRAIVTFKDESVASDLASKLGLI